MSIPDDDKSITYEAENADKIVSEIFSGKISLEQALQRLRTRLLDLSSRNRLLNYRFPKGRSIQFVDKPNLNLVFHRLADGKSPTIKCVPDPPPESYMGKRPDVKLYAQSLGVDIDNDFHPSCCGPFANGHTPKLQALYYPTELDKLCRKINSDARTIIEETGTNMLYLVFGFLEFSEREDSEKSMLAPLLAVPITLEKGSIDQETRTYRYSISYSGDDICENHTLREKLSRDFSLQFPDFSEEDEPGTYFAKVEQAVQKKKRWKVRYQLTIGFLSFGKLAIWDDLDPKKWPSLLKNDLLNKVFSGGSTKGVNLFPEDYDIDNHAKADLPLIYDADSSQHSAIIDVLSGKNIVINGPPGTGKSQTITNVIAAGLRAGKKILFVSDKLAALQVVRNRLNQANLSNFCLELHSHKTHKKKVLGELQERLEERFRPPQQLQDKIASLIRHKKDLNRHATLMATQIGNELGLTVHEVFWKTERCRQSIGDLANVVQSLFLAESSGWILDDILLRKERLEVLGQLYETIGSYDQFHPWWGFVPKSLAPGDNEAIGQIIGEALSLANNLVENVVEFQNMTGAVKEPSLLLLENLHKAFGRLSDPPTNLNWDMLPRVFNYENSEVKSKLQLVKDVIQKLRHAKKLKDLSDRVLASNYSFDADEIIHMYRNVSEEIASSSLAIPLNVLEERVLEAEEALNRFRSVLKGTRCTISPIQIPTIESLDAKIEELEIKLKLASPLALLDKPMQDIRDGASRLGEEAARLRKALEVVRGIALSYGIDFDDAPDAIALFCGPDGIEEILPGVVVNEEIIAKAESASDFPLNDLAIADLDKHHEELCALHEQINILLDEVEGYCRQLYPNYDGTKRSVCQFAALAEIASCAPSELLDYRHPMLAHPRTSDLLAIAEDAYTSERNQRELLEELFYLDMLPPIHELKAAIGTFRRGDRLLNFLNSEWRGAKKLFKRISKGKQKYKAYDYETTLTSMVRWIEHHDSIINNEEFANTFGPLFKGINTNFNEIKRLHTWYIESNDKLLKCPGFIETIDLTTLAPGKLSQLASLAPRLRNIVSELERCICKVDNILGPMAGQAQAMLFNANLYEYNHKISGIAKKIKDVSECLGQYIRKNVSPRRAVQTLQTRLAILSARDDFSALKRGSEELRFVVGQYFPEIQSIPCNKWSDYLNTLSRLSDCAISLVEFIDVYSCDTNTPNDVLEVLEAKLAMDIAIEKIAVATKMKDSLEWTFYISTAESIISIAAGLVNDLKSVGAVDKTAEEIVAGLNYRHDSKGVILELAKNDAVRAILRDHFQGIDTDVDNLVSTLEWGEMIRNNLMISSLHRAILSSDVGSNFYRLREILQRIADFREDLKVKLNQLNEFGSLNLEEWNSFGNSSNRSDFSNSIRARVDVAAKQVDGVLPWAKYNAERNECEDFGLSDFIIRLERKKLSPRSIGAVFEFVTYRSIGRAIYTSLPELEGFTGKKHEKKRAEFSALDQEIISLTGKSFAYEIDKAKRVPSGETGSRASDRTELQLILHELGKQRRHLPIRQLIKRAGRAIQALKPCFMMGPMSVAQYLEQGAVEFDMVVMDEASQLRPEEALGAVVRGKQLVVVGDPKQLPPTNFFDRMLDAGDDDELDTPVVLVGTESILDICQQVFHPVRTLRWHYRSQHESLIAFSNHQFYNGKLVVFPSPFDRNNRLGIRYRYLKNGVYKNRQNAVECSRVVDSVIEHMIKFPEESLGVVTLNQTQRDLMEDMLDVKLRNIPEAQDFIAKWEEEGWPFFIKNLENVQGDERDVIFISTTFGKAPGTEKPRQNFGPISRPDGWRRLNVLFTRARRKIELFTSMLPEDIVVDTKTPAGTRALRDYLDFAQKGVLPNTSITGREPDSDFEIAVGDMLQNNNFEVVPQLGVAGFFIDLAVRNPDRPGEFLAAVECDGATYHSSKSARDRDRIRQEILESLGWKDRIWRIWSTDWFYDPHRESERLLAFLEERRTTTHQEPVSSYVVEEVFEEATESDYSPILELNEVEIGHPFSLSEEDLFVEVGDRVTYCFVDKPEERHEVVIVDKQSNDLLNWINEGTPVAKALLNSTVGDEPEVEVKGRPSRIIRVLRIHRQNGSSEILETAHLPRSQGQIDQNVNNDDIIHEEVAKYSSNVNDKRTNSCGIGINNRGEVNKNSVVMNKSRQFTIGFGRKAAEASRDGTEKALEMDSTVLKREAIRQKSRANATTNKKIDSDQHTPSPRPLLNAGSGKDPLSDMIKMLLPDEKKYCQKCYDTMDLLFGPYGPYLRCPKCKSTGHIPHPVLAESISKLQPRCAQCGRPIRAVLFRGKPFVGCSGYPDCKHSESWTSLLLRLKTGG